MLFTVCVFFVCVPFLDAALRVVMKRKILIVAIDSRSTQLQQRQQQKTKQTVCIFIVL